MAALKPQKLISPGPESPSVGSDRPLLQSHTSQNTPAHNNVWAQLPTTHISLSLSLFHSGKSCPRAPSLSSAVCFCVYCTLRPSRLNGGDRLEAARHQAGATMGNKPLPFSGPNAVTVWCVKLRRVWFDGARHVGLLNTHSVKMEENLI